VTCRVLGVRRQGYYEFVAGVKSARVQENELLLKHIEKIHEESRGTYGWPRVHAELTLGLGLAVNHKRVARLMREAGIQGLYRPRRHGCTVRDPAADPYPDLVERRFSVEAPDQVWLTDITEHGTEEGKLNCTAVLEAYSRRIVGWSIDDNMRTALVTDVSAWPSPAAALAPDPRSCTPTTARNSRPGPSGNACGPPDCWAPWARSAIATTTR
jgi:putative transposase